MTTRFGALLGIAGALLLWHGVGTLLDAPLVLPLPGAVAHRLIHMPIAPLLGDTLSSLGKVAAVLALVVLGGVPAGVVLGLRPGLLAAVRPVLVALQAMPWSLGWRW